MILLKAMKKRERGKGEPMTHGKQQLPWKEFAVFNITGLPGSRAKRSVMNGFIYGQRNNRTPLTRRLNSEFPVQLERRPNEVRGATAGQAWLGSLFDSSKSSLSSRGMGH